MGKVGARPQRAKRGLPTGGDELVGDACELARDAAAAGIERPSLLVLVQEVDIAAIGALGLLAQEIEDYYGSFRVTTDLIELRNLHQCADLIVRSALRRHESRGLHYSRDFPDTLPKALPSVLTPARR